MSQEGTPRVPAIGEYGHYCVYCRRWWLPEDLLPLRGRRRVKAGGYQPGEETGRCRAHQALSPVSYVRRTH